MKSKYFLSGLGFGITVTAIIFLIANIIVNPAVTDKEIKERAANLGMVEKDGADTETDKKEKENTDKDSSDKDSSSGDNAWADANTEDLQKALDESIEEAEDEASEETKTEVVSDQKFNAEEVVIALYEGETSRLLSEDLKEKGIIDDSESFNTYLESKGYAEYLQTGFYTIKKGSSFEDIAHIITKNKIP